MTSKLKFSASTAALALLLSAGSVPVKAADPVDPGCMLSGSVMAGYMYNWQSVDLEDETPDELGDKDVDWSTPFGEGAGLVTCGGFNIQADIAYYAHSADTFSDADVDQTNSHIGGVLFYRDPASWAGGLGASWISQDVDGADIDVFRVGLFGEFYFDEMFTLGGSAYYFNIDWPLGVSDKDEDGFELAAWGKFYATPDLAFTLRGDVLLSEKEFVGSDQDTDFDGFAITGDGEYLVWDQGLALFAGARYAERKYDDGFNEVKLEDFQVFGGIKFYFGQDGTLIERQRTGTVDNTSVFNEKLPNFVTSTETAVESGGGIP